MDHLVLRSQSALVRSRPAYQRELYGAIDWSDPLIVILGPRGVGKRTLILQRLASLSLAANEALYVDMGDLYFQSNRLIDFVESYIRQGGRYLFIDEVHRYGYDTWAAELKQIHDLYRDRIKLVVTGSSIVRILAQQADLSRRALVYRLDGLSFREYLLLTEKVELPKLSLSQILHDHQQITARLLTQLPLPLPRLSKYWQQGYYPYFLEKPTGYVDRLASSVQTVLDHDLPYATQSTKLDVRKLSRLLSTIASSVPFTVNMEKIGQATGISRLSLLRYFELLSDAQLITTLRNESRGLATLAKPDKVYLDNPNLLHALSPSVADVGHLRETFFLSQLRYLTRAKGFLKPEISLPRKGDFVFSTPDGRRYLFEVGGPNKDFRQIGEGPDSYVICDTDATGQPKKIPLWLFGLLY